MLTEYPLAPSTMLMRPGWGPTLIEDQHWAGAIMWVGGDGLMLLLMVAVAVQWSARGSQARLGDWLESASPWPGSVLRPAATTPPSIPARMSTTTKPPAKPTTACWPPYTVARPATPRKPATEWLAREPQHHSRGDWAAAERSSWRNATCRG
ncbi:MAG: cytochrome c oxidase assembly protein [Pseudonocardiaceae bacterium]